MVMATMICIVKNGFGDGHDEGDNNCDGNDDGEMKEGNDGDHDGEVAEALSHDVKVEGSWLGPRM